MRGLSFQDEAPRIEKARRTLAALQGARAEVRARLDETVRLVAIAKGRLALKGRIDAFLEELQVEAHRRNVGSFEKLLTLLARDVLPGSTSIGLELSTERGLPSLDIFAHRDDGVREDVFLDKGGAMTNVVSAGLRVIAAVKSGGRRLLVLDEPDCWIAPGRIPDFYRVLRQAAEQVGVQCLVISHHSHALFGDGIEVARLENSGDVSTIVSSEGCERLWSEDMPGFRALRLADFQIHKSSELRLSPGVTALIGPNDRGKSSIVRALAAVLYGDGRESLIRHGEASCRVELEMEHGRRLTYTRHRRRNPLNMWTLTEADGTVVEEDGVRYETGGRNAPDWIAAKTGVAEIDGLRVHVSSQKFPVFLLGDPPQRRASVLSVGQETSHLREMIVLQRERTLRDQQTVRDGEKEVSLLNERLGALEAADRIEPDIEIAATALESVRAGTEAAAELEAAIAAIERARQARDAAAARHAVLAALPEEETRERLCEALRNSAEIQAAGMRIAGLTAQIGSDRARLKVLAALPEPPALAPGDEAASIAAAITTAHARAERLRAVHAVLSDLPDAPPALVSSEDLAVTGRAIVAARTAAEADRARLAAVEAETAELEHEAADLLAAMDNLCPTCGHDVADAGAFLRHVHPQEAA